LFVADGHPVTAESSATPSPFEVTTENDLDLREFAAAASAAAAAAADDDEPEPSPTGEPAPKPRTTDPGAAVDRTLILDAEQNDELMALRAQQDKALKQRFEKNVAVLFSDVVGSTAYYEKYGDVRGREMVLTHNALLFPLIQNAGGVIIKTIGDAIMACFDSVNDALAAAAAMQHTLSEHNQDVSQSDEQIHIRIAINYGVAIAQEGDVHGDVVNVAARIEREAKPDEIWLSERVQRAALGWPLELIGAVALRGKVKKTKLFRLNWQKIAKPEAWTGPARLAESYAIGEMMSHGALGDTFSAQQISSKQQVCIKTLHKFLAKHKQARNLFRDAATNMARLSHPGVVRVLDWSDDDAREPFYVTEYVAGRTLEALVRRHGCPPPPMTASIVARVAEVLAAAQKEGVPHGDLRPECIIVDEAGALRLQGFGMAPLCAAHVARTGSVVGSPAFMAPELLTGKPCTAACDVYSLGALLYFLISGQPPFEAAATVQATREVTAGEMTPLAEHAPDAPAALVRLVERCLATAADERPASALAVAEELVAFCNRERPTAPQELTAFLRDTWPHEDPPLELSPSQKWSVADLNAALADSDALEFEQGFGMRPTTALQAKQRHGGVSITAGVILAVVSLALAFVLGWRFGEWRAPCDCTPKAAATASRPAK
jgi:class 3 adenylate cyclase